MSGGRVAGRAIAGLLFFGAWVGPQVARGDQLVLTNLGLLRQLTREAVAEVVDSLRLEPGAPVSLISSVPHEGNDFVQGILAQTLVAQGHEVRLLSEPGAATPPGEAGADGSTAAGAAGGVSAPTGASAGQPAVPESGPAETETAQTSSGEEASSSEDVFAADEDTSSTALSDDSEGSEESNDLGADTEESDAFGTTAEEASAAPETPPAGASPPSPPAASPPRGTSSAPPGLTVPHGLPPGDVLDVRLLEFGVVYRDVGRRLFLGPVSFTRVAGAYIQVSHLQGPSGELKNLVSAERHHWDRLSGRQKALVEGASYPFAPPALTAPSLGRYVEPAVVVAIVGSLIYLFYTNQN